MPQKMLQLEANRMLVENHQGSSDPSYRRDLVDGDQDFQLSQR